MPTVLGISIRPQRRAASRERQMVDGIGETGISRWTALQRSDGELPRRASRCARSMRNVTPYIGAGGTEDTKNLVNINEFTMRAARKARKIETTTRNHQARTRNRTSCCAGQLLL